MRKNTAGNSSLLRVVGAVVFVAAVVFLTLQQANFLLSRGMLIAFGDSEATYQSAWFEWDGDVTAKNVVIYPYNLSEDVTIRFERVHLETPGWFWFVRNTFDRKLKFAKLDRVHLTLTGGGSDTGLDPSLGDLGPFSIASASPFEAEGCAVDGMWSHEEVRAMGLDVQPPSLEFDYRVEGTKLSTKIVLESRGASRVQLDRTAVLPTAINALLLDQYPETVHSERWEVQDQGFVPARNRYCAKKDRIAESEFVKRHMASVERVLLAGGIAVDEATREAYRTFARRGGRLSFGGDYTPGLGIEHFYEMREAGDAWPRMGNARLATDRSAATVQWTKREPWPLPEDADSVWQALVRERGPEVATTAVASTTPATAPGHAVDMSESPSGTPTAPTPHGIATVPAAEPAAVATQPGVSSPTVPSAAQPPVVVGATAPVPAAQPVAIGSATAPPSTAEPRILRAVGPPSNRPSDLAWSDMPALRGQRVRLWTQRNPARLVYVLEADGDALRITTRLGGGSAEYTVHRDSFLRARLVR